jgi:hypothetical protein
MAKTRRDARQTGCILREFLLKLTRRFNAIWRLAIVMMVFKRRQA